MKMTHARQVFDRDPFGVVFSCIVTAAALALAVFGPSGVWQAVGTFVAAIAGAHISWIVSSVSTIDRAREILRSELETASMHLAEIAGRISLSAKSCATGSIEPEIAVDRIAQHVSGLYGLVHSLQKIAGVDFDSAALISTVTACEDMIAGVEERLGALAASNDPVELQEMKEDVESIRMRLASAATLSIRKDQVLEFIGCPTCGARTTVRIGLGTGESATGYCPACSRTFHVNRKQEGLVARPWGGTASVSDTPKYGSVSCPECDDPIPFAIKPNESTVERYCLSCCKTLVVIDSNQTVVRHQATSPLKCRYVRITPAYPYFKCPQCQTSTVFLKDDYDNAYGVCRKCHSLVVASKHAVTPITVATSSSIPNGMDGVSNKQHEQSGEPELPITFD